MVTEGLFAYMDVLKIGMVDYPRLLAVLRKPTKNKLKE
jgi:hypothetical protein